MTTRLERLLSEALHEAGAQVEPSEDLFARIRTSIDADQRSRRARRRWLIAAAVAITGVVATVVTLLTTQVISIRSDSAESISSQSISTQGETAMAWWILELLVFALLVAIALILGPFIKRFGRRYAADIFRSNPSTGKSFIVLTDFAYYLIFSAYIMFTTTIDRPREWSANVGAEQVEITIARVGGILLIIGLLHGVNLLVLPIIGRLLTLNRRLDQQMREVSSRDLSDRDFDQSQDRDATDR